MAKKIGLAADHAGFEERKRSKKTLDELGIEYVDLGTTSADSVDYPDYAKKVAEVSRPANTIKAFSFAVLEQEWRSPQTK